MKKIFLLLAALFVGCETNQNRDNANWDFDSSTGDYIQWQSDNDFANEMTNAGFIHLYNFEYAKAIVFFEKALEYDPSLFGPHVVLAGFSIDGSDKQKMTNSFLPPLLKFYLRLGGRVSDHAVIDRDLDTLHVFTYLDLNSKKNN